MLRFKERDPLLTVEIIRRFFEKLSDKLSLTESDMLDGGIGVYSLSLQLHYGETPLLQTNGKGMQPEFARASAYAELYERFCNRYGTTGYLFDDTSEETEASPERLAAAFPRVKGKEEAFLRYLLAECPSVREKDYIPIAAEDAPLRVDPRHIFAYCGTNGMAAGNTTEEALVQGISEVVERNILCRCFFAEPLQLFEIPDVILEANAPESYEKIRAIRETGFSLRFFDAAESTGLPVVISLWVSKAHGVHAVKFGAFPVFSVAVERCITEVMQGRGLMDYSQFMQNAPYREVGRMEFFNMLKYGDGLVPEELFTDAAPLQSLSSEVYLHAPCTNREMLSHFAALGRSGGFHLYYHDVSLTPEMAAVQVFSPELNAVFPAEHLLMEDCPAEVAAFLEHPYISSAADAALLSEAFDAMTSLPDALCARLHLTGLENCAYIYVAAVLALCGGDMQRACELLEDIETTGGFEYLPDIAALRCCLRYHLSETDAVTLRKKLALWGYDDVCSEFLAEPVELCNRYLSDVLFGTLYQRNKALTAELNHLLSQARDINFR